MPNDPFDDDLERGLSNRRQILGDEWVDRALANTNELNADFQSFITRYAWHEVWGRPGLPPSTRRLLVLAVTAALGRWEEFEVHLRAALLVGEPETRIPLTELREALVQLAVYAGVPAANTAFRHVGRILDEAGAAPPARSIAEAFHTGVGRPLHTRSTPTLFATVREPRNGSTPLHTLVLSHALGCDGSLWDSLATELSVGCRVICYDHRGHGRSAAPAGPYTLSELADDAARLLEELTAGPVVFIGISLGGMVAQELALRHPARVKALVIANASSSYGQDAQRAWQERIELVTSAGLGAIADATMRRWFHEEFHVREQATVQRWRRRLLATEPHAYVATCQAIMDLNTTQRLSGIAVPGLVIAGELDTATPMSMSEAMQACLPRAKLVVLERASHLSVLEQPRAFAAAVASFLSAL